MIPNTILAKNARGLKALVVTLTFPSAEVVEMLAHAGFDAVNLDGEHGAFSPESVDLMCRVANGCGMSVIARVPRIEAATINLWLDRGVQGITAPRVESGTEARLLVDSCLYPMAGKRSWGWGRGSDYNDAARFEERYGGRNGFADFANVNVIATAQIETKAGYDHLDEILAVPGLHSITGGPNDFCASLGVPGQPDHPERVRLTADAEARARAAGKQVTGDYMVGIVFHEWLLESGRALAARHAEARLGG